MDIKELRQQAEKRVIENADIAKINKILNGIESGKISKDNFYRCIKKFTKNITSDHSINRWECLSEWFYNQII